MKQIGILGTGVVGQTLGARLIELGYAVKLGSRTADNPKTAEWVTKHGIAASQGTFNDAAAFGEILFNCTKGDASVAILQSCDAHNLAGKVLIDVSNPLDFSRGMPPILIPELCNTTSLGETIQATFPDLRVVKTLNIVNCEVMADAQKCGGHTTMLLAGNDADAKQKAREILQQFGWADILDLGGIMHARSTEMMLPVWLSIYLATKNMHFGFKICQ